MMKKVFASALGSSCIFQGALTRKIQGKTLIQRLIDKAERFGVPRANVFIYTDLEEVALKVERLGANSFLDTTQILDLEEASVKFGKYCAKHTERSDTILWLSPYAPLVSINSLKRAEVLLNTGDTELVFCSVDEPARNLAIAPLTIQEILLSKPTEFVKIRSDAFVFIRGSAIKEGRTEDFKQTAIDVGQDVFEIASFQDWWVCEKLLARKRIVFRVIGNERVGMGHIYRALSLAHEILDHEIIFITDDKNEDVIRQVAQLEYRLEVASPTEIVSTMIDLESDLVINDILDTSPEDVTPLQTYGARVVNFEDLGEGAKLADLTINELYDRPQFSEGNILWGKNYLFVRDEFEDAKPCSFHQEVKTVLLAFGGIDQHDLSYKILEAIEPVCDKYRIGIEIVTGPGYRGYSALEKRVLSKPNVSLTHATGVISKIMEEASVAITSNGRTVYEMAHMNVPAIVVPQHKREKTHGFASRANGFIALDPYKEGVTERQVAQELLNIISDNKYRKELFDRTVPHCFTENKQKIVDLVISQLANNGTALDP